METDKIYLGDAYELIKGVPDKSIDLIITDPPYLYVSGGGGGCFGSRKKSVRGEISPMSKGLDYSILEDFERVEKQINVYIWCSLKEVSYLLSYYEKKSCVVALLCWHKTNPIPTKYPNYLINDTEYCVFARKKAPFFGSVKSRATFMISSANIGDKKDFHHPTIKPLSYIKNLISNSSSEGGVVLDPFAGSGTTCIAAKELGRHYIGFEIEPKWHTIAVDRLNGVNANGQISLFADFEELEKNDGQPR